MEERPTNGPTPEEMEGLGAYTVNVYIEYLDTRTGQSVEIMPDGGMVYETDSAAVASTVAEFLIDTASAMPPVGQLECEDAAMGQILETQ
ncbi:MAG: hypothetical protein DRQ56_03585 [Gammaproteobacteria bacterium]|nr:MAG: hypothetical protein DRQ56_03585 [Gammaproteobacteria bacterium]